MELHFLGGADEVGRSAILIKAENSILLDYGIKLNEKNEYPLVSGRIDAFVLSHAHLDHSGFAPSLYANYSTPSFGTAPTLELSKLLIEDSIKISRKRKQKQEYSKNDLRKFERSYAPYSYGSEIDIGGCTITLHDAGHVCGSAITSVESNKTGRKLVYTGDFKTEPQLLQGSAELVKSNILLIESTYANRDHPKRDEMTRRFIEEIRETLDNGGTALVPVFAVGRAQEIISILYKNNLIDYTVIDGMAQEATEIIMRYPNFSKNKDVLLAAMRSVTWIGSERSRGSVMGEPAIIVTTAGMLNGGPVLTYLTSLNAKSKIFLTGYQVEGTNGRRILEGRPIVIDGNKQLIKTPLVYYDFSAHAGKEELHEYVRKSGPEKVFCVHGDRAVTSAFAEELKIEGFDAHAPKMGEVYKINF